MESSLLVVSKKAYSLLISQEKKGLKSLTIFMFIMAIVEVVCIAALLPFMNVVMDTSKIYSSELLNSIYTFADIPEKNFVVLLGISSFCLILFSSIVQIYVNKKLFNYTWGLNHTLSSRLITKYLKNDYDFFLNRNSSELTKNIITEVQQVVYGIFFSIVTIISRALVILMVLIFLLLVDPLASLAVGIVIVGGYLLIYTFMKKLIMVEGQNRVKAHEARFKAISESIGGIKEIKLMNKEEIFLKNFENPSKNFSISTANNNIYQMIPKSVMEVLALGGILLVIILSYIAVGDAKTVMPIATVYAFAGYRLMPSLQTIFRALAEMKYNSRPLNILYDDLHDFKFEKIANEQKNKFVFSKNLSFKNISFSYSKESKNILENISIELKYGKSLAIKGTTGSGKTTLIDILLGLLKPTSGYIEVDGVQIDESNLKDWQQNIAYVPQFIFLLDDTVAANIAFGDENIDMERIKRAANQAMLDDVIENLDNGFETQVGEDGVKLSGGQRQRIGLARALYRLPRLLILDEATSALDEVTESKVMKNIYNFSNNCTVIMIAHRLSTIEKADEIIDLSNNEVLNESY